MIYSKIEGIQSIVGPEAEGWLISVGGTPREMMSRDPAFTYKKLIKAAYLAKKLGAEITYKDQIGFPPLIISGKKILGGEIFLSAEISSQYITALILIAPMLEKGLIINLQGACLLYTSPSPRDRG